MIFSRCYYKLSRNGDEAIFRRGVYFLFLIGLLIQLNVCLRSHFLRFGMQAVHFLSYI